MQTAALVISSVSLVVSCVTLTAFIFGARRAQREVNETKTQAKKIVREVLEALD